MQYNVGNPGSPLFNHYTPGFLSQDDPVSNTAHAQEASSTLSAYMKENSLATVHLEDLYHLANDQSAPDAVRSAAAFMLGHPRSIRPSKPMT